MLPDSLIVSISGIRGIVDQELTSEIIEMLVSAYIQVVGTGTILIAGDSRSHTSRIQNQITKYLQDIGCNVLDAGIQPTPTLNIAIPIFKARGGIVITASHNPEEYNGLKFFDKTGHYLNQVALNQLLQNVKKNKASQSKKHGTYKEISGIDEIHLSKLKEITSKNIKLKKINVLVDAINGAGCDFVKKYLTECECNFTIINDDPNKPFPRQPEPNLENLKSINNIIKKSKFDVGFATDPDCDRVIILTPKRGVVCEEYTLALSIMNIAKHHKQGNISINYATSLLSEQIANDAGLTIKRAPVGEHNVYLSIIQENSILGGEGNGGVMDPRLNSTRDSFTGMAHILSLLAESDKTIDKIIDDLPKYEIIKDKVPIDGLDLQDIYQKIESSDLYRNAERTSRDDGVWIMIKESWVLFRPSNTEPIARIIAEAKTLRGARLLIELIKKSIVKNSYFVI